MGSLLKNKEGNPGLVDIVFSWSICDIMHNDLYKNRVQQIEDKFSSSSCYLNSFIKPLIEETHAGLRSSMTSLHSAPILEILRVEEDDKFDPPEKLFYNLKLEKSEKSSDVYEFEVGDLIALTEVRPKCIDDLEGAQLSFHLALVKGMRDEDTSNLTIISSKLIFYNAYGKKKYGNGRRQTLYAVSLTNLTTNLRIWKALHSGKEENMGILSSVLTIDPSMEEKCARCSEKMESGVVSKSRELIAPLGLDDSQKDAVLKCIALRECNHRNSVELIWGPPGTGKTKTIASLLFSLFRVKCRALTCAPTNVAVLEVAKRLMTCLRGTLEFDAYGLGDVVLYVNGKRTKIAEHEDLHDVFLDYRISALLYCFTPMSGWRGSVDEMIGLLQDPETKYLRYLEQFKDRDEERQSVEDDDGDVVGKGNLKKDFLRKLVSENAKENKKKKVERRESERDGGNAEGNNDGGIVPMTFEEFFAKNFFRILERIVLCTELLYTHMPTSCLTLNELRKMTRALDKLQTLENFISAHKWSKVALMRRRYDLCFIRLRCLKVLKLLRAIEIPQFFERYEIRNFCLENSCLIFCTVSCSSKLNTRGMAPFELVIIDEAAQVKECESTIPLQLPGLRHAILVGDEKQLPPMVISEICEKAGFGRSLFERLVILGHSKHLLNVQYRMNPSISLFPNKEFYGNQIMNGRNVTERGHERSFLKAKIFGSYSFINVTNGKEEFDNGHSRKNMMEVYVVAEIVSKLYKESMKSKEKVRVGCISPYKAQVFAIQELFGTTYSCDAKDKFSVNVRSVDGFQGGEEDIIIISTVRCNDNGSIGFLNNLKRTSVALTRARYCLWILGNAATLQKSGSVWRRLVADAKDRGCFHNAYEDKNLCGAIRNALIALGQLRSLFTADSILFKAAKWKVCFSAEFHESMARYRDPEIHKEAASLLEKLSNGWRQQQRRDGDGIRVEEGKASQLVEWNAVKVLLRLVWTTDILREKSTDTQVIKVLDLRPRSEVARIVQKFDVLVRDYTLDQLNRCLCKRRKRGLVLPMTWPVDRPNSRSNYSSNDLATQLSEISLRNDPTPPRRRNNNNAMKLRKKQRRKNRVQRAI